MMPRMMHKKRKCLPYIRIQMISSNQNKDMMNVFVGDPRHRGS